MIDTFIASILGCERNWFNQFSFSNHQSQYGYGYTADYDKAIGFSPKSWLMLHFDFSNLNGYDGPPIDFYFPISMIGELDKFTKFIMYQNLASGLFPTSIFRQRYNLEFELHHINQEEDKVICLPTDIHGGFSDVIHTRFRKLSNRARYESIKPFLYTGLGKVGLNGYCTKYPTDYPKLKPILNGQGPSTSSIFHHSFDCITTSKAQRVENEFTQLYFAKVGFELFSHLDKVNPITVELSKTVTPVAKQYDKICYLIV
jgi:hypothetical protein